MNKVLTCKLSYITRQVLFLQALNLPVSGFRKENDSEEEDDDNHDDGKVRGGNTKSVTGNKQQDINEPHVKGMRNITGLHSLKSLGSPPCFLCHYFKGR